MSTTTSTGTGTGVQIFVSYRHEDVPDATDRLKAALKRHFGEESVFADIDNIEIGADFAEVIQDYIARCDVLLAVIGRDWIDASEEDGTRRLENPDDWVRLEIEAALSRNIRVVPVLVHEARLPTKGELPESLQPLLRRNAIKVPRDFFDEAVQRIIDGIEKFSAKARVVTSTTSAPVPQPPQTVGPVAVKAPSAGAPVPQGAHGAGDLEQRVSALSEELLGQKKKLKPDELAALTGLIGAGESVLDLGRGNRGFKHLSEGVWAITDRRLLFVYKKANGQFIYHEWSFSSITTPAKLSWSGVVRAQAGHETIVIDVLKPENRRAEFVTKINSLTGLSS